MANSDRYSNDDHNINDIEDTIHDQANPASKRDVKAGTKKKASSKKMKKPGTKTAAKKVVKPAAKVGVKAGGKKAVKKSTTNRVGKTAVSKEATMRAMAKQKLADDSAAERKALKETNAKLNSDKNKSTAMKKSVDVAGSSIIWTLLGLGLAACGGGGTKYIGGPATSGGEPASPAGGEPASTGGGVGASNSGGRAYSAYGSPQDKAFVGDGPVQGAEVFVDADSDGVGDVRIGVTDRDGFIEIPVEHQGKELVARGGTDTTTGTPMPAGWLRTFATGETVMTPLTTIVRNAVDKSEEDKVETTDVDVEQVIEWLFAKEVIGPDGQPGTFDDLRAPSPSDLSNPDNYSRVDSTGFSSLKIAFRNMIADKAITINEMVRVAAQAVDNDGENSAQERVKAIIARAVESINAADGSFDVAGLFTPAPNPDAPDATIAEQAAVAAKAAADAKAAVDAVDAAKKLANNTDGGTPIAVPTAQETSEDVAGGKRIELRDFGFRDQNPGDVMKKITFINLSELKGTLKYINGRGVEADVEKGDEIDLDVSAAGHFVFIPVDNANGTMSFTYTVTDTTNKPSPEATMEIKVAEVNDAPSEISLTGNRGDEGDSEYYLVTADGRIKLKDGDLAGVITVRDVEDTTDSLMDTGADKPPVIGGVDASHFEIVREGNSWVLKLKQDASKNAGEVYNITLSYTDAGGLSISKGFAIHAGGTDAITHIVTVVVPADPTSQPDPAALTFEEPTAISGDGVTAGAGQKTVFVDEGTAAGRMIYDANANNPAGVLGDIVYSLTNDADGKVTISSSTGEVSLVNAAADFETGAAADKSFEFTVGAKIGEDGTVSEQTVTVTVTDVAEAPFVDNVGKVFFDSEVTSVSGGSFKFTAANFGIEVPANPTAAELSATYQFITESEQVVGGHYVTSGGNLLRKTPSGQNDEFIGLMFVNGGGVSQVTLAQLNDNRVIFLTDADVSGSFTLSITRVEDSPAAADDDGTPSVRDASEADRTFDESVPQTTADIASKVGGIILTNEMFGIVDVDTLDADVDITMLARPTGAGADTDTDTAYAYVGTDGQVTIDDGDAGVIQVLGADGVLGADETWSGSGAFTLADLKAGKVRFKQDVDSEASTINLHIDTISDGTGTISFGAEHRLAADDTEAEVNAKKALVQLIVDGVDDDQLPQFSNAAGTLETDDAATTLPAATVDFNPSGILKTIIFVDPDTDYRDDFDSGTVGQSSFITLIGADSGEFKILAVRELGNDVYAVDIGWDDNTALARTGSEQSLSVTISIDSDGAGGGADAITHTMTVVVPAVVNAAPNAMNDIADVNDLDGSSGEVTGSVRANDTDAETNQLDLRVTSVWKGIGTPDDGGVGETIYGDHGTLTMWDSGFYAYRINKAAKSDDNGNTPLTDTFTYTLSDGDLTDTATLTITVDAVDDQAQFSNAAGGALETDDAATTLPAATVVFNPSGILKTIIFVDPDTDYKDDFDSGTADQSSLITLTGADSGEFKILAVRKLDNDVYAVDIGWDDDAAPARRDSEQSLSVTISIDGDGADGGANAITHIMTVVVPAKTIDGRAVGKQTLDGTTRVSETIIVDSTIEEGLDEADVIFAFQWVVGITGWMNDTIKIDTTNGTATDGNSDGGVLDLSTISYDNRTDVNGDLNRDTVLHVGGKVIAILDNYTGVVSSDMFEIVGVDDPTINDLDYSPRPQESTVVTSTPNGNLSTEDGVIVIQEGVNGRTAETLLETFNFTDPDVVNPLPVGWNVNSVTITSVTGLQSSDFEIKNNELFLKQGVRVESDTAVTVNLGVATSGVGTEPTLANSVISFTIKNYVAPAVVNAAPNADDDTVNVSDLGGNTGDVNGNVIRTNDTDAETDQFDLRVTSVWKGTGGTNGSAITDDADGETINGDHGTLTMWSIGYYVYRINKAAKSDDNGNTPLTDIFTYELSDGDLTDTATLTIRVYAGDDQAQFSNAAGGALETDDAATTLPAATVVFNPSGILKTIIFVDPDTDYKDDFDSGTVGESSLITLTGDDRDEFKILAVRKTTADNRDDVYAVDIGWADDAAPARRDSEQSLSVTISIDSDGAGGGADAITHTMTVVVPAKTIDGRAVGKQTLDGTTGVSETIIVDSTIEEGLDEADVIFAFQTGENVNDTIKIDTTNGTATDGNRDGGVLDLSTISYDNRTDVNGDLNRDTVLHVGGKVIAILDNYTGVVSSDMFEIFGVDDPTINDLDYSPRPQEPTVVTSTPNGNLSTEDGVIVIQEGVNGETLLATFNFTDPDVVNPAGWNVNSVTITSVTGLQSSDFEIKNNELFLKQGVRVESDTAVTVNLGVATSGVGTEPTLANNVISFTIKNYAALNAAPNADDDIANVSDLGRNIGDVGGSVTGNDTDVETLLDDLSVTGVWKGTGTPDDGGVGEIINGDHGTLTISADGSYVYRINKAAKSDDNGNTPLTDIFTYELSDGVLTDTATLTIMVYAVDDQAQFSNAAGTLETGAATTTLPAATVDFVPSRTLKTITFVDPDTDYKDDFDSGTVGESSFITLTGDDSDEFKILAVRKLDNDVYAVDIGWADNTAPAPRDSEQSLSVTISIDGDGADGGANAITHTMTVVVPVNTAPNADDDIALARDTLGGTGEVRRNVIRNDTDAETDQSDLRVTGVWKGTGTPDDGGVGEIINGDHGTLTIWADGFYDYRINKAAKSDDNGNTLLTDIFTYKLSDGGLTDTATLTIAVIAGDDQAQFSNAAGTLETGAATTTLPAATVDFVPSGTLKRITFVDPDTDYRDDFDSGTVGQSSLITLTGDDSGEFKILAVWKTTADNGDDVYSVDIGWADNTAPARTNSEQSLSVTISIDGDGASGGADAITHTMTVVVPVNTAPNAMNDTVNVSDLDGGEVSHNVRAFNDTDAETLLDDLRVTSVWKGTDGTNGSAITPNDDGGVGEIINGDHGSLTIWADGSYVYRINRAAKSDDNGNTPLIDIFTYELSDGGLTDTATLTIRVIAGDDQALFSNAAGTVETNDAVTLTALQLHRLHATGTLEIDNAATTLPAATVDFVPSGTLKTITFVDPDTDYKDDFDSGTVGQSSLITLTGDDRDEFKILAVRKLDNDVYAVDIGWADNAAPARTDSEQSLSVTISIDGDGADGGADAITHIMTVVVPNAQSPLFSDAGSEVTIDENIVQTGIRPVATDADGDAVTLSLLPGVLDNDLFEFVNNEIVFKDLDTADYESGKTVFKVTVTATSVSELGAPVNGAENTGTKTYTITLAQVDEAPSNLELLDEISHDPSWMVKLAYLTLIVGTTTEGNIEARLKALTDANAALKAAFGEGKASVEDFLSHDALAKAVDAILDPINAQTGTPPADPTPTIKLARLNATTAELKKAVTDNITAIGALSAANDPLSGIEARLIIGADAAPKKVGTLKVTDSDKSDAHIYEIGGPNSDLFTIEVVDGTATLFYVGGKAGLVTVNSLIGTGDSFVLPITVTDQSVASLTKNFTIVYVQATAKTLYLAADNALADDADQNAPELPRTTLKSGEKVEVTKNNAATPPVAVTQTVGGVFENADGSGSPHEIGEVNLTGIPSILVTGIRTNNDSYRVVSGSVVENGDSPFIIPKLDDDRDYTPLKLSGTDYNARWWLVFGGNKASDYEANRMAAELELTFVVVFKIISGFTGYKDVQADGEAFSADARTFTYSGGAVTVVNSVAEVAGVAGAGAEVAAELSVSVAQVTFYHPVTGEAVIMAARDTTTTLLVSDTPGTANQVVYALMEAGVWVLKLGEVPTEGDFYVLTQSITAGDTAVGAIVTANTAHGSTVSSPEAITISQQITVPYNVPLKNLDDNAPEFELNTSTVSLDEGYTLKIVIDANANAISSHSVNKVITVTLPAGTTIGGLATYLHNSVTSTIDSDLGPLFDEAFSTDISNSDFTVESVTNFIQAKGIKHTGGNETAHNATDSPVVAAPADVEGQKYTGTAYKGASTGIVVQGAKDADGDAIVYRMAAAGDNDNALVTLGMVDGKLTIVFRKGGPDFEYVRNDLAVPTLSTGEYIFVVEAVSNSKLSDDARDRSSRAGEKVATQTFKYTVDDIEEAPWDISFSNGTKMASISSDGTIAKIDFNNDASDIPANETKYEGVDIRITGVTLKLDGIDVEVVNFSAVFEVDPDSNLNWFGGATGARMVTLADRDDPYTLIGGETFKVSVEVADKDNSNNATTAVLEVGNGLFEGNSIILTSAHLLAAGQNELSSDTVFIITEYQNAFYHQTNAENALDDDKNVKMGWIELKDSNGDWQKLDAYSNGLATGLTFTQADVNAGNVRFVSSGADANPSTSNADDFTAFFKYVVRDNAPDEEGNRVINAPQTATVNITNTNDAPFVDNVGKVFDYVATSGNARYSWGDLVTFTAANFGIEVPANPTDEELSATYQFITESEQVVGGYYVDGGGYTYRKTSFGQNDEFIGLMRVDGVGESQFTLAQLNGNQVIFLTDEGASGSFTLFVIRISSPADDDGTPSVRTASVADRTFDESVPQTTADIASKVGGIILTNEMFGIVDVDTPDADVDITMLATPTGAGADTAYAYVGTDGQVTIDNVAAGVIQVLGDHDNNSGTDETWSGSGTFTLADLKAGKVRFKQDVDSEASTINLHIDTISDGTGTISFGAEHRLAAADDTEAEVNAKKALVQLIVVGIGDDQQPQFSNAAGTLETDDAATTLPAATVDFVPSRTLKTITFVDPDTDYKNDFDSGTADQSSLITLTGADSGEFKILAVRELGNDVYAVDIGWDDDAAPAPTDKQSLSVTISIDGDGADGGADAITHTMTVAVPVNTAPNAVNDIDVSDTPGNTGDVNGNVIRTNDTDAETDQFDLRVTSVWKGTGGKNGSAITLNDDINDDINGDHGTLTMWAEGFYIYSINKAATGTVTDIFTYELSDGALTDTATLTITVHAVDDQAQFSNAAGGALETDDAATTLPAATVVFNPSGILKTIIFVDPDTDYKDDFDSGTADQSSLITLTGADSGEFKILAVRKLDNDVYAVDIGWDDDAAPARRDSEQSLSVTISIDGDGAGGGANAITHTMTVVVPAKTIDGRAVGKQTLDGTTGVSETIIVDSTIEEGLDEADVIFAFQTGENVNDTIKIDTTNGTATDGNSDGGVLDLSTISYDNRTDVNGDLNRDTVLHVGGKVIAILDNYTGVVSSDMFEIVGVDDPTINDQDYSPRPQESTVVTSTPNGNLSTEDGVIVIQEGVNGRTAETLLETFNFTDPDVVVPAGWNVNSVTITSVTGLQSSDFEIKNNELFLKQGVRVESDTAVTVNLGVATSGVGTEPTLANNVISFTIKNYVVPVNTAPNAVNDIANVSDLGGNTGDVNGNVITPNDTDAETNEFVLRVTSVWKGTGGTNGSAVTDDDGGETINGDHGTLKMWSIGYYSYRINKAAKSDTPLTDIFTYELSDGDLTDTATLTIRVDAGDDQAQFSNAAGGALETDDAATTLPAATVVFNPSGILKTITFVDPDTDYKADFDSGTVGESSLITLTGDGSDEFKILAVRKLDNDVYSVDIGWADDAAPARTDSEQSLSVTISIDGDGAGGGADAITHTMTVVVPAGVNTAPNADDDIALARDTLGGTGEVRRNVIRNDTDAETDQSGLRVTSVWTGTGSTNGSAITPDADGETINGEHGTLTMWADGAYIYRINKAAKSDDNGNTPLTDIFTYTLSDGALIDTATLTIAVDAVDDQAQFSNAAGGALETDDAATTLPAATVDFVPIRTLKTITFVDPDTDYKDDFDSGTVGESSFITLTGDDSDEFKILAVRKTTADNRDDVYSVDIGWADNTAPARTGSEQSLSVTISIDGDGADGGADAITHTMTVVVPAKTIDGRAVGKQTLDGTTGVSETIIVDSTIEEGLDEADVIFAFQTGENVNDTIKIDTTNGTATDGNSDGGVLDLSTISYDNRTDVNGDLNRDTVLHVGGKVIAILDNYTGVVSSDMFEIVGVDDPTINDLALTPADIM